MSYINIAEWTPTHVVQWLQGLDDSIQPYVNFFLDNQVNGCRLLLLESDDLDKLHIKKIGHQQIILDSVDLLRHLHYSSTTENLQSLALKLGCKSRSLYNHLRKEAICGKCENCIINANTPQQDQYSNENEENELYTNLFQPYKKSNVRKPIISTKRMCRKITTFTLNSVCDILNSVKKFITWIDRYSFEIQDYYTKIRQTILRISIELASTAQRDHFVENPKEIIKNNCLKFAEICERIVQELNDSLCIQPACLECVPIKRKENEELGVQIYSSFRNVHVIGEIKIQSPAHRSGRLEEGDEIIQINYQTVLGWTQTKLIDAIKEYPTKILITIKKGPSHSRVAGQLKILESAKIPNREVCIKPINNQLFQEITSTINQPSQDDDQFVNQIKKSNLKLNEPINDKTKPEILLCKLIDSKKLNSNSSTSINTSSICLQNHENKECCEKNIHHHKQLIEQLSIEKPTKGPVYKPGKPKRKELLPKRRATISGISIANCSTQHIPICLEDLMNLENISDKFYLNDNLDDTQDHNLYKSFNNLTTNNSLTSSQNKSFNKDHHLIFQRKTNLNKRTLSEDTKMRSISVYGYDEIYGGDEFTNYLSLPKSAKKIIVEKKNLEKDDNSDCFIRNNDNATVINITTSNQFLNNNQFDNQSNKSIDQYSGFDYINEKFDCIDEELNTKFKDIQVTKDNKNIVHVHADKQTSQLNKDNAQNKHQNLEEKFTRTIKEQTDLKINNNLKQNLVNNDNITLSNEFKNNKQQENGIKNENTDDKPEIIKRKKSLKQAKLIKNLNLKQLRNNADHSGWLNYLREELNRDDLNNVNNKSSLKWRSNYLIIKNELIYFYLNDDDNQQPLRIINLPTFNLDDNLELYSLDNLHVFKIFSMKYAFYFGHQNLDELNEWLNKIRTIIKSKKNKSPKQVIVNNFKPNTLQYHSFNSNHHSNQFNNLNGNHNAITTKNSRLAQSFRDLNLDENTINKKINYLNGLMSSKSIQQFNQIDDNEYQTQSKFNTTSNKYLNNGIRSISCVDSNFLNKYKMNKHNGLKSNQSIDKLDQFNDITNYELINQNNKSIDKLDHTQQLNQSFNSTLPPLSKKPQIIPKQFYLNNNQILAKDNYDLIQLNKQNHNNQLIEQNQINQKILTKKEIPKPIPRISKMKQQQTPSEKNVVGKIISSFDELSKQCDKELDYYSSLRKRSNNQTNHNRNDLNTSLNNNQNKLNFNDKQLNTNNKISPSSKYVSVLDQEYNRLFKHKNPPNIKTATSKEIQSIYLKSHEHHNNFTTNNHINNQLRSNSPTSDHSLSSSSGISSYYSMNHDHQQIKFNEDTYSSNTSTNNFNFSPNSTKLSNSSFEQQNDDSNNSFKIDNSKLINRKIVDELKDKLDCINDLKNGQDEEKTLTKSKEKKQTDNNIKRKSSFNSFRLFGSSKVLSKLNSSLKDNDKKEKTTTNSFLTTPKRSFFGLRKNSLNLNHQNNLPITKNENTINQINNDLNRNKSKSSELLNTYIDHLSDKDLIKLKQNLLFNNSNLENHIKDNYVREQFNDLNSIKNNDNQFNSIKDKFNNRSEILQLTNQKLLIDNYETYLPPDTPTLNKKPTMGIKILMHKRRSSTVSCDRGAIEQAIQINNEKKKLEQNNKN